MVSFTFERITRAASFDASQALPLSEAARATHESFESHLQRAAPATTEQPAREPARQDESQERSESTTNQPPRNELAQSGPVRQDAEEPERDDAELDESAETEATTAPETAAERNENEVEAAAVPQDEAGIVTATAAADELLLAARETEREAASDSDDGPDRVVATKPSVAPVSNDETALDASFAATAETSATEKSITPSDEAPAVSEVKLVRSDGAATATSESSVQRVDSAETKEVVVARESLETAQTEEESTIPNNEPPPADNKPRRPVQRGDVAPHQGIQETPEAAPKPVAVDVVEAAVDIAGEDSSQQHRRRPETDAPQPTANTAPADTTAATSGTPSRFAQHLLVRSEDPNGRGPGITNADQVRFVERVARAVQATGERGGSLRLRLSPPELGSLTLEVKVQGGVVSARVEADTSAARSLLLEHLPLLRERLAEHGMRVDQFDVDLSERQSGGTPDGLQHNGQQGEDRPRTKVNSQDPDDTLSTIENETPTKSGNEQLNIIV